jgi:hypothetical protein
MSLVLRAVDYGFLLGRNGQLSIATKITGRRLYRAVFNTNTSAFQSALQCLSHTVYTLHEGIQFLHFFPGKYLPARIELGLGIETLEQRFNFPKRESGLLREFQHIDTANGVHIVISAPAVAGGLGKDAGVL